MVTFAIVAASDNAFEIHAAGCRDLRKLSTPFDHMVDAKTVTEAIRMQVTEFAGLLTETDFTVQPCCALRRCLAAGRVRPDAPHYHEE